ncbi:MAG: HNH endonuclease signature motif containing protein [Methylicorpusculum sp.]|uniref:HNH endonuclease signature motif containing protein n=1 Tax=Methylicorpusculum sp. TaxID=2713644 RepID=UPI00272512A5|nr:HNH endonuclease signature motif containing protein [Methylicorpusculum sp.]MDO8940878.1 HNH endonuclease signature motif containing protein [Methylicorpusculum sp.]
MAKNNHYTQEQLDWLREYRPKLARRELTAAFNERFGLALSVSAIDGTCKRLGLYTGRTGCFEPGHETWNKDIKGYRVSAATEFKTGNRPANAVPVGTERLQGDGYLWVKIAEPKTWRAKHNVIWEAEHGPVPKGHTVIFLDGNKENLDPANLHLVSRTELLKLNLNRYRSTHEALKPVVLNLSKLQAKCHIKPTRERT